MRLRFPVSLLSLFVVAGCADGSRGRGGADLGSRDLGIVTGTDAATPDAGPLRDAGPVDGGGTVTADSGSPVDLGTDLGVDLGTDLGVDLGTDLGVDLGTDLGVDMGPPPTGCMPLPASGSITVTGVLDGSDPVWARPLASGTCPASGTSSVGTAVPYDSLTFCNEGISGSFTIGMTGDSSTTSPVSDCYLIVYSGTSIPADPLACLEGDDDGGAGTDSLLMVTVAGGSAITIAPSGFDNADVGGYALTITRN